MVFLILDNFLLVFGLASYPLGLFWSLCFCSAFLLTETSLQPKRFSRCPRRSETSLKLGTVSLAKTALIALFVTAFRANTSVHKPEQSDPAKNSLSSKVGPKGLELSMVIASSGAWHTKGTFWLPCRPIN